MKIAIFGNDSNAEESAKHFLKLGAHVRLFEQDVYRIQKRSLGRNTPEGRSRMVDLFRVFYGLSSYADTFKELKLDKAIADSLEEEIEQYDDFDFCVVTNGLSKAYLGQGNEQAANESFFSKDAAIFDANQFLNNKDIEIKAKSILIAGNGSSGSLSLHRLYDWLIEKPEHVIYLASTSMDIFFQNKDIGHDLFLSYMSHYKKQCESYEKKVFEWRQEKQGAAPTEPTLQIKPLFGYGIGTIDKLIDREGLFLTLEANPLSDDKALQDYPLKTIQADMVLNTNESLFRAHFFRGINPDREDGVYFLNDLSNIKKIEENMLTYFSRK